MSPRFGRFPLECEWGSRKGAGSGEQGAGTATRNHVPRRNDSMRGSRALSVLKSTDGLDHPRSRAIVDQLRRAAVSVERSEEHTSELQSPYDLVCRLLL